MTARSLHAADGGVLTVRIPFQIKKRGGLHGRAHFAPHAFCLTMSGNGLSGYSNRGFNPRSGATRSITATIAAELAEAVFGGHHYRMLFLIGAMLFVVTFLTNLAGDLVMHRLKGRLEGKAK